MSVRITARAVTRETEVELTFRPNVSNETPNRASLATVTEQRRVNQSLGKMNLHDSRLETSSFLKRITLIALVTALPIFASASSPGGGGHPAMRGRGQVASGPHMSASVLNKFVPVLRREWRRLLHSKAC
jgi:hypothetical protein